jgi:alkylation response protein AidB-like acyl-CoA dehydrogenase
VVKTISEADPSISRIPQNHLWSSFGQRTTASGTTTIDDVAVEDWHILPHRKAFDRPTTMGPIAQIIQAAVDVGIAKALAARWCVRAGFGPGLTGAGG